MDHVDGEDNWAGHQLRMRPDPHQPALPSLRRVEDSVTAGDKQEISR